MATAYLDSTIVGVFPSIGRTAGIDPEAELTNEGNLTQLVRSLCLTRKSYVLSKDTSYHPFEFIIDGFYFRITDSGWVDTLGLGDNIWAGIKVNRNSYAENSTDNYQILTLANGSTSPQTLQTLDVSDEFQGVVFASTEEEITQLLGDEWGENFTLEILRDGEVPSTSLLHVNTMEILDSEDGAETGTYITDFFHTKSISASETAYVGGTLTVSGATNLNDTLTVSDSTTLLSNLAVTGDGVFYANLTVSADFTTKGNAFFEQNVEIAERLDIEDEISGTSINLSGNIDMDGSITTDSFISAVGPITSENAISSESTITAEGGLIADTLTASTQSYVSILSSVSTPTLTVSRIIPTSNTVTISGSAAINSFLDVTGPISGSSAAFTGAITTDGDIVADGTISGSTISGSTIRGSTGSFSSALRLQGNSHSYYDVATYSGNYDYEQSRGMIGLGLRSFKFVPGGHSYTLDSSLVSSDYPAVVVIFAQTTFLGIDTYPSSSTITVSTKYNALVFYTCENGGIPVS